MQHRILSTRLTTEPSLVLVRDRARQVGSLFGLEELQRTRLTTAVSEIARNAILYAKGGKVEFLLDDGLPGAVPGEPGLQSVMVRVEDQGPGIAQLERILDGSFRPRGQKALGLIGSRRLADTFEIASSPAGTVVTLSMHVPRNSPRITPAQLGALVEQLARRKAQTPMEELEQRNREMLQTLEALRVRQEDLQAADERKDEFLAMLAHELRNPLGAIHNTLQYLERRPPADAAEFTRARELIGRQTRQLSRLVDDLMDVSRITRGKVELHPEMLRMDTVLAQAVETAQSERLQHGHQIEVQPPAEPFWLHVDAVRIRQVLGNLIHNAMRYTPQEGRIELQAWREGGEAVIEVRDNGIGIDAEMLPRVFDLFTQGRTHLSRRDSGLGIGLTVVKRLVEAHGGSVHASSAGANQGSAFTLRLPAFDAPPETQDTAPQEGAGQAGRRILLIDDNVDNVDMLAEVLRLHGQQVMVAHDGIRGLEVARTFLPHAIVVDIGLPVMDGFEVGRALRAEAALGRPFMATLSGYGTEAMRQRSHEAGYDVHFTKPVDVQALLDRLKSHDGVI